MTLIRRQGAKTTRAGKRKFSLKSFLAVSAAVKDSEVVNYNLLTFLDISQCIDGVPLNTIVLALLGVVVIGIVNTIYIKEDTPFPHIFSKEESVRLDNSKVP